MTAFLSRSLHEGRRGFLKAAGLSLALPLMGRALETRVAAESQRTGLEQPPQRMVCLCTTLGLYTDDFTPAEEGKGYTLSPYLQPLAGQRDRLTVFSGLSHPEVDGGHSSEMSFLTGAPHPAAASFRNTISLDQYAAAQLAPNTRLPYLTLSTGGSTLSWTNAGVAIPAESSPRKLYETLFLDGSERDRQRRRDDLANGRSVLDLVSSRARKMETQGSAADRQTLQQYFTSVREMEQRLESSQAWVDRPKPQVEMAAPEDVTDRADFVPRQRLLYDLLVLALQTDSTRIATLMLAGNNLKPPLEGVESDWHNLSHHGRDPEKIAQLRLIELEEMRLLGRFLDQLAEVPEAGRTLLDSTMVLFGSNLGNASNHSTKNMPMLLAGGSFDHGRHLAYDAEDPPALAKLYVSMLQKLGLETDRFASGEGTLI